MFSEKLLDFGITANIFEHVSGRHYCTTGDYRESSDSWWDPSRLTRSDPTWSALSTRKLTVSLRDFWRKDDNHCKIVPGVVSIENRIAFL
jgi:hypothetical protein